MPWRTSRHKPNGNGSSTDTTAPVDAHLTPNKYHPMPPRVIPVPALFVILTSCQNASHNVSSTLSVAERIERGIDWDNRTLPKDRKNLSIIGPSSCIGFTVPDGWHIQDQPGPNKFCYTLTHDGTFGTPPFLKVETISEQRGRLSENRSHQERLGDIQTNFPSARMHPAGSVRLPDGRSIRIVEYVDGDLPELASFVPEKDHVTAFYLSAENKATLENNRTAFEAVLRSYHPK